MRRLFIFTLLWCAAFSVAARQQPQKPAEKKDPNLEKRLRLYDDRLDRGLHRRSDAEVITPSDVVTPSK